MENICYYFFCWLNETIVFTLPCLEGGKCRAIRLEVAVDVTSSQVYIAVIMFRYICKNSTKCEGPLIYPSLSSFLSLPPLALFLPLSFPLLLPSSLSLLPQWSFSDMSCHNPDTALPLSPSSVSAHSCPWAITMSLWTMPILVCIAPSFRESWHNCTGWWCHWYWMACPYPLFPCLKAMTPPPNRSRSRVQASM